MAKTLHIVSILDRSGSMMGTENEVIGAYNKFIEDHKKLAEDKDLKIKATLVLFDHEYDMIYEKSDISLVPELNSDVYCVRGMTSLYDAVGKTINAMADKKKVIFFIETDGYENSSKEFNANNLKTLVEQKTKDGWDFNFVGADLDSMTTKSMSMTMGIDPGKSVAFSKTHDGYAVRNSTFLASTQAYVGKDTE